MAKVFQLSILLFFVFLLASSIIAQAVQQKTLSKIEFTGLKKNKETYLKGILQSKINKPLNFELLETDIQNLKNLNSVANATFQLDTIHQNITLTISIEERTTILPILNFGGIKGNIWFTIGIMDNNLRGYGNLASAFYQNNNGRHSGQIYFKNPQVLQSDWGYSFLLNKWASDEPVFFEEGTRHLLC